MKYLETGYLIIEIKNGGIKLNNQENLKKLRDLLQELIRIHPGDKRRVEALVREFVKELEVMLPEASPNELNEIAEILHELETVQYNAFKEILSQTTHYMLINDILQKFKWSRLQSRLSRK